MAFVTADHVRLTWVAVAALAVNVAGGLSRVETVTTALGVDVPPEMVEDILAVEA